MEIRVECPKCGYVMSVFDETLLRANKAVERAFQHALKNPILCAGCSRWIQRPRVDRGAADELPSRGDLGATGSIG